MNERSSRKLSFLLDSKLLLLCHFACSRDHGIYFFRSKTNLANFRGRLAQPDLDGFLCLEKPGGLILFSSETYASVSFCDFRSLNRLGWRAIEP